VAKKLVNTLACACVNISESGCSYQAKYSTENALIADWLLRLTSANKRWDFGLCFLYLRNVKGFSWKHKRIYRIYRELELNLRIKPSKRLKPDKPDELSVPAKANQVWSMDFMSEALADGCDIRSLNVIDDYNLEGLAIDVDLSIPSLRVIRTLEQMMEWRSTPAMVRFDNGPKYVSNQLVTWAIKHDIILMYIQPGKLTQNAYIERFNRASRHEWLDVHEFESVAHAQYVATKWLCIQYLASE
jgi:putative transposase